MAQINNRSNRLFDHIGNYRFHLLDVSFAFPIVFNVSYGFASVTAPEVVMETKDFKPANSPYKISTVVGATVSDMVLRQGVSLFNSDFYQWASKSIDGLAGQRRSLLLLMFSEYGVLPQTGQASNNKGVADRSSNSLNIGAFQILNYGDLIGRVPARAWRLFDCMPISYKAGSDFDALGNEISIAELTIRPKYFEEYNLGV